MVNNNIRKPQDNKNSKITNLPGEGLREQLTLVKLVWLSKVEDNWTVILPQGSSLLTSS